MGQVNCRKHYLSLRKSLVLYVIAFVVLAVFLSVVTFFICGSAAEDIRSFYPPSGEKYYLTNEQGEQLGEGAYIGTELAPMSKQDERTIAILEMLPVIAAPIYSAFCIIAAALLFYRNRLKKPLAELRTASEKIANNDLDFSIDYDNSDELGQLCASFEIMRTTLADNFSKMWRQVEERKALNAAFAHDLRTPLTVLKGYNEMLQASENPQTQETAAIMGKHISRMESYVSSMSNLRRMEDAQPEYKLIDLQTVASSLYDSAKIVSKLTSLRGDTAMQIYGYCRISTPQQNIERQVRNILATYPTAHIIREVYTGTTYQGRRELDKLLHTVQAGDTIVFDSVSRMSRNADEGCQLYEDLYAQNVTLCFLKEPHINTETYRQTIQRQINTQLETGNAATDSFVSSVIAALNQYTVDLAKEQIRLAFAQAQKEVDDLHQRTREGMLTAKLNGKQIGQERGRKLVVKKAAACKESIRKYSRDFDGTLCDADCIRLIGIARNTYYKYKGELREAIPL